MKLNLNYFACTSSPSRPSSSALSSQWPAFLPRTTVLVQKKAAASLLPLSWVRAVAQAGSFLQEGSSNREYPHHHGPPLRRSLATCRKASETGPGHSMGAEEPRGKFASHEPGPHSNGSWPSWSPARALDKVGIVRMSADPQSAGSLKDYCALFHDLLCNARVASPHESIHVNGR